MFTGSEHLLRAGCVGENMDIGISTACFYPMTTEDTLTHIASLDFRQIEVFVNSPSESTVSYAKKLRNQAEALNIKIIAFHPFSSFAETYCLFSAYERRRQNFFDIYKGYFESAAIMGAKTFNFHGCRADWQIEPERYCEIYYTLYGLAKEAGVRFSQENVNRHHAATVNFITLMHHQLKDDLCFTFDVKQAMRSGEDPCAIRDAMGNKLIHFHASDYRDNGSCALPGQGICDYKAILNSHIISKNVSKVIEVYSDDYSAEQDLQKAAQYMNKL